MKVKVWREWHKDFIRDNDADQMTMLCHSMAKYRHEDKLSLRRQNRFCNTGPGNNPGSSNNVGAAANNFAFNSDGKGGYRPPSSSATYNSCSGMPMQIRSRFQKKQPATVVRNSHSNTAKGSAGAVTSSVMNRK